MNKLKHKDILPYLSDGKLFAEMLDYQKDYVGKKIDEITGLNQWDSSGELWCCLTAGGSKPSPDRVKPYLRELKDINREIEHKGKKFNPNNTLSEWFGGYVRLKVPLKIQNYILVKQLEEWKFDTNNLINRELANKVTDEFNPYK